jgi:hypothetical protein
VLFVAGWIFPVAFTAAEPLGHDALTFYAPPKPLGSGAVTEEWPHFLGPRYNATTKETPLLKEWPKTGPNQRLA